LLDNTPPAASCLLPVTPIVISRRILQKPGRSPSGLLHRNLQTPAHRIALDPTSLLYLIDYFMYKKLARQLQ